MALIGIIFVILLQIYLLIGFAFGVLNMIRSKTYGWRTILDVLHWVFLWPLAFR